MVIELHRPRADVFAEAPAVRKNHTRFRLSPEGLIAVGARAKAPGEVMRGEDVELLVAHHPEGELMAPYERLLGDALDGDPHSSRARTASQRLGVSLTPFSTTLPRSSTNLGPGGLSKLSG